MQTNITHYEDMMQLEDDILCFLPTVSDIDVFGCEVCCCVCLGVCSINVCAVDVFCVVIECISISWLLLCLSW